MTLPGAEEVAAVLDAAAPVHALVAVAASAGLLSAGPPPCRCATSTSCATGCTSPTGAARRRKAVQVRAPKYGSERSVITSDALLELLAERVAQHRRAAT